MTQSIIVYRNPMEQAMWEGTMGAELVPIGAGLIVFLLVVVLYNTRVVNKFMFRQKKPWYAKVELSFVFAGIAALATAKLLWI